MCDRLVSVLSMRVLTIDDWPLWREVRLAALSEAPQAFKARLVDWPRGGEEQWLARFKLPGTYNLVALLNGRPVGMARGVPTGGAVSELRSVWVSPEARGQGVADALTAAVVAWAVRSGASVLKLAVLPGNDSAIALYRRNGFVFTGEVGDVLADGATREKIMEKVLRPAEA